MKRHVRRVLATIGAVLIILAPTALFPGCAVGYLAQQGYFQAELLVGRQPIERAIADGHFTPPQLEKLALIPAIKEYGQSIGLEATDNYETINPTWDRQIWNLSACDPVSFESKTWWFPVVGRVPYLGYFREKDAERRADKLRRGGWDVYLRTAGAYSTLGWFRDPVLPGMLGWSEHSLADTLLHELAHATLWVPGSVAFNESFANFVGEKAALSYLAHKYGEGSEPLVAAQNKLEDRGRFRLMMHDVYKELDAVYRDASLDRSEKLAKKAEIFASLGVRTAALELHGAAQYQRSIQSGEWNNARLAQFKTYNRSHDWFEELLAQQEGDLLGFIHRIGEVTDGADDPYAALAAAVGASPEDG